MKGDFSVVPAAVAGRRNAGIEGIGWGGGNELGMFKFCVRRTKGEAMRGSGSQSIESSTSSGGVGGPLKAAAGEAVRVESVCVLGPREAILKGLTGDGRVDESGRRDAG